MRILLLAAAAAAVACTAQNGADRSAANQVEANVVNGPANGVVTSDSSEPARTPSPGNAAGGAARPAAPAGVASDGQRLERPTDRESDDDQCAASRLAWLVGQPRSNIPAKPAGATWRVVSSGSPITMDYSPARLNIFYDEKSGIVESVRCG